MVGSVGMARSVSRPNSLVIQEALNLLSALGGNKAGATTKLLEEMKGIQIHNENVILDAKAELVRVNQRDVEVGEREEELARELIGTEELYRLRLLETTDGEAKLQHKVDQAVITISEETARTRAREDQLRDDQGKHEENMRTDRTELVNREQALIGDKETLKELEASIKDREDSIKSDRATLDDLHGILDKRKIDLDERDARMRAAMGN